MALVAAAVDELVIPIRVTGLTCETRMSTGQRKLRRSVIERCRLPGCCGMTLRTRQWETKRSMVRIGGTVVICPMTIHTIHREPNVLVVHMTRAAANGLMRPREREIGFVMRKHRWPPRRRGVARLTCRRKLCGDVVRICC